MSGGVLVSIREQGVYARLETEHLDQLSPEELMKRLADIGSRDPCPTIEKLKSNLFRSLEHAKELESQVTNSQGNTREDLRRTVELIREHASHAAGEVGFLEESMLAGDLERSVYHAIRAGHYSATTEALYHEPNASLGKRQRPHPAKAGRARQSVGETKEDRYRKIVRTYGQLSDDDFPKVGLKVEEVAKRLNCSSSTIHRALRDHKSDS